MDTQVECRSCGTCVWVIKYSPAHTSVQWDAQRRCVEFAGTESAHVRTCGAMRDTIDDAVLAGVLGISTRDRDVP